MVIDRAVVAICTHNPNPTKLQRVFLAIMKNSGNFRTVLIDNASTNLAEWKSLIPKNCEYILEPNLGNAFARSRAIKMAKNTELLIFVDDDNYIDSNYINNAIELSNKYPRWGAFGGIQLKPETLIVRAIFKNLLPFVGIRNLGPYEDSQKAELHWNSLEPIGAGMCIRPEVVQTAKINIRESDTDFGYFSLGRKGKRLLSGEDSYLARQAAFKEFEWGYSPDLVLTHDINPNRLSIRYFSRLLFGYGRTDLLLSRVLHTERKHQPPVSLIGSLESYVGSFLFKKNGPIFPIFHFGQYFELRRQTRNFK